MLILLRDGLLAQDQRYHVAQWYSPSIPIIMLIPLNIRM